jgi:hypothetical protein
LDFAQILPVHWNFRPLTKYISPVIALKLHQAELQKQMAISSDEVAFPMLKV